MNKLRWILLFPFFVPSIVSYAQEASDPYHPLVEEGKHWTYDNYLAFRPDEYNHYYRYYLMGDTLICGKTCQKMYSENENNDSRVVYKGALYEENQQVYLMQDGMARLLYDFGCQEGDEITTVAGVLKVIRIRERQNGEHNLRIIELRPKGYEDNEFETVSWMEGVGCTTDFFAMLPYPGNYKSLVSCEVGGKILYQYVQPQYTEEGYHEMAIEGKTWNYIHHYEDEICVHEIPYSYVVRGDTVIGRTTCKKLYYRDENSEYFASTLFESGRDLYKLYPGHNAWIVPYQFGRTDIGRVFDWDSRQGEGRVYWMLHTIDTISVKGTEFRRLIFLCKTIEGGTEGMLSTIEDNDDVWHEIWIEGVGSQLTGIDDPIHERPQASVDYTRFVSCYEDGRCIFSAEDFTISALSCLKASTIRQLVNCQWHDLSGRRLSAPPAKGIYIEDGQKRVARGR